MAAASPSQAFSLVELSIVMIIGSMLLLTVTGAKSLLERSHTLKLAADLLEIRQAVKLFTQKYNNLPGDYPYASQVIQAGLMDGNGDGYLGTIATQQDGSWNFLTNAAASQEQRSFFQHLQASGLLLNFTLTLEGYLIPTGIDNLAIVPRIEFSENLYELPINSLTLVNFQGLTAATSDPVQLSSALSTEQLRTLKQHLDGSKCQQGSCLLEGQLLVRILSTADYVASTNIAADNCFYNHNGQIVLNLHSKRKCTAFLPLDAPTQITANVQGTVND